MKFRILLCGCGKLGTRYLQGLINFSVISDIYVYDISTVALHNAQIFIDCLRNKMSHNIIYSEKLNSFPKQIDLVILSTTANNRFNLIEELNSNFTIKNWIIEKIIAQSFNELCKIDINLKNCNSAYVNTPRRAWSLYYKLKNKVTPNFQKKMKIIGNFGLVCNAIHFIDLFAWLTDEKLISVNCDGLDKFWIESKRITFWEVSGILTAIYSNGSVLTIDSRTTNQCFKIFLYDTSEYVIDEDNGIVYEENEILFNEPVPLQSELTPIFVDMIFHKGFCNLPSLKESITLHKPFLESIQKHWNEFNNLQGDVLKIT